MASELRRLKDLEAENAELKRLLADTMLDNAGLKVSTPEQNWATVAAQKWATLGLRGTRVMGGGQSAALSI